MTKKTGIHLTVPGFDEDLHITDAVSDYTGTHAYRGEVAWEVIERLSKLAELLRLHILTSDTFGTVRKQLEKVDHVLHILEGERHDVQKAEYAQNIGPEHVVAFGNGRNDRALLKTVRDAGGLAIAVDNGEGVATEAVINSNILATRGSVQALDLLLADEGKRVIATLRS